MIDQGPSPTLAEVQALVALVLRAAATARVACRLRHQQHLAHRVELPPRRPPHHDAPGFDPQPADRPRRLTQVDEAARCQRLYDQTDGDSPSRFQGVNPKPRGSPDS